MDFTIFKLIFKFLIDLFYFYKFFFFNMIVVSVGFFSELESITFIIGCISFIIFLVGTVYSKESFKRFSIKYIEKFNKNFFDLYEIKNFLLNLCSKALIYFQFIYCHLICFYKYLFQLFIWFKVKQRLKFLKNDYYEFLLIMCFFCIYLYMYFSVIK